MKNKNLEHLFLVLVFFLTTIDSLAQQLDARFDIAQFKTDSTEYLETYLSVAEKGVKFIKNEDDIFQAQLRITIQFLRDDQIITADKYNLLSPEIKDTNSLNFVFVDQQRYSLKKGTYKLKLNIVDINNPISKINHEQEIQINDLTTGFSDIELVDQFTQTTENIFSKNGYDLVPFISNLYNSKNKKLNCYFEYYNNTAKEMLIQCSILFQENRKLANNLIKSKKTNKVSFSSLNSFSIEDLPSGTYILRVEARNTDNELIHFKEREFYKLNKNIKIEQLDTEKTFVNAINNKDSLALYIKYTYPIQTPSESSFADNVLDYENLEMMQKIFDILENRDPFNKEQSWLNDLNKLK